MAVVSVARHKTAIHRSQLSRPIRVAFEDGLINNATSVFDYGCGHGDDLERLTAQGVACAGWDPAHRPHAKQALSDVVNLGYVVNVIEKPAERLAALQSAWRLTQRLLIVAARLTVEAKEDVGVPYEDGCITRSGTFQKFYEQHELRLWIDSSLGVSSIPAGPGIFYVFRDDSLREIFIASRYRRRTAAPRQRRSDVLFEQHKELLEALIEFIASRGRLPEESEWDLASRICDELGSIRRAFTIIRRATGEEQWDRIREIRAQDLLMYLALARFGKRSRFSQLPYDLQSDVRAFFSTYSRACALADELLFSAGKLENIESACRTSPVGKLTPNALYVHESALPHLPAILRIYEGCARAYIGAVDGANVIKLHRGTPQVSYLSYPEFEKDPHPELAASLIVPLQTFHIRYREYTDSKNPPILHRKEEFIAKDHPLWNKFAQLTRQEEQKHLYDNPELIGTREGWQKVLNDQGVRLSGHRLLRKMKQEKLPNT